MATQQQQQILEQQQGLMAMAMVKNSGLMNSQNGGNEEDQFRSLLTSFQAKEEEIERRKMMTKEKVAAQMVRVQDQTKRLGEIREELEAMQDPLKKEVAFVRKRIDIANKELRPLGLHLQKKEREYKEALGDFNEKSAEKAQLLAKLTELVGESEKMRMKKLEELSKGIASLR